MAIRRDIMVDLTTGARVVVNGHFQLAEGRRCVAQMVAARLRTHVGEWWLNTAYGIDYRGVFLKRAPSMSEIEARLRRACLQVRGVTSVRSVSLDLDRPTRTLTFTIELQTDQGDVALAGEAGTLGFVNLLLLS